MKPGIKSSEHLMTWAMSAIAGGYGLTHEDPRVNAAAMIAIGFIAGMYQLSRGLAKRGANGG